MHLIIIATAISVWFSIILYLATYQLHKREVFKGDHDTFVSDIFGIYGIWLMTNIRVQVHSVHVTPDKM